MSEKTVDAIAKREAKMASRVAKKPKTPKKAE